MAKLPLHKIAEDSPKRCKWFTTKFVSQRPAASPSRCLFQTCGLPGSRLARAGRRLWRACIGATVRVLVGRTGRLGPVACRLYLGGYRPRPTKNGFASRPASRPRCGYRSQSARLIQRRIGRAGGGFIIHCGQLYHRGQGEAYRLCVLDGGRGLRTRILLECRGTPLGGHLAATRRRRSSTGSPTGRASRRLRAVLRGLPTHQGRPCGPPLPVASPPPPLSPGRCNQCRLAAGPPHDATKII